MKLNCIRLLVNDFDKCFRFYAEQLNLNVTWGKLGGEYASFDIGLPSGLELFKSDLMATKLGNYSKTLPLDNREKIALVLNVDNVDETYSSLLKRGVVFVNKPKDMPGWGDRVVHFRDPEGNVIELRSDLDKQKWDANLLDEAKEFEQN